jgi:hypothetical protein
MERFTIILAILLGITLPLILIMLIIITYENITYEHLSKYTTFSLTSENATYYISPIPEASSLYEYIVTDFEDAETEATRLVTLVTGTPDYRGIYINISNNRNSIENLGLLAIALNAQLPIDYLLAVTLLQEYTQTGEWDFNGNYYPPVSIASNINKFDYVFVTSEKSIYQSSVLMLSQLNAPLTFLGVRFDPSVSTKSINKECNQLRNNLRLTNLNSILYT